jgi:hypothetical protein
MKEFKVIIPGEKYIILEYKQDNLPAIMAMNFGSVNSFV